MRRQGIVYLSSVTSCLKMCATSFAPHSGQKLHCLIRNLTRTSSPTSMSSQFPQRTSNSSSMCSLKRPNALSGSFLVTSHPIITKVWMEPKSPPMPSGVVKQISRRCCRVLKLLKSSKPSHSLPRVSNTISMRSSLWMRP